MLILPPLRSTIFLVAAVFVSLVAAAPSRDGSGGGGGGGGGGRSALEPRRECRSSKPPAFVLAGDSTTAVQSPTGGGWGTGFLSFLRSPAFGANHGRDGATTASFADSGEWARVLREVRDDGAAGFDCYVTIQFGHNDQLPSRGVSREQFRQNLENFAQDVRAAGGTPIILSPLTRREFKDGSDHEATDSLHDQRLLARAAAEATLTRFLDLNAASLAYIDAIGSKAAHKYDSKPGDVEHLDPHGSVVFGRMVADLVLGHEPAVNGSGVAADAGRGGEDKLLVQPGNGGGGYPRDFAVAEADADGDGDDPEPWPECLRAWFLSDEALSRKIWHGEAA